MATGKRISLQLTAEQKAEVLRATGKNAEALELSVEELEDRIAPVSMTDIVITKTVDKGTAR